MENNLPLADWGSAQNNQHIKAKALHITKDNKSVYLTGVWMLGLTSLISLLGIIGLAYLSKEVPQALIAIGSVAVGALGGLLNYNK